MNRIVWSTLGAVACLAVAPAAQAATTVTNFGPSALNISVGAGGTVSASFDRSGIAAGDFTDIYTFTIPSNGFASGSVITNANFLGSVTDLDFTSVFFNGVKATGLMGGLNEALFVNNVPIVAGATNTITINGTARGNGSYGGQGTFTPTAAVPEPATWAMMLMGFGAVGYGMRRRKSKVATQVRFA